jgi:predicted PurR-regulated permease PerM
VKEPVIIEELDSSVGWNRSRIIFLGVSLALVIALVWWASEVLLPFILALIIAYVLTPLVALSERARIPRAVSIILVYILVFGLMYVSIAAMAPRLYDETAKLARDAPALGRELAAKQGPRLEHWVQGILARLESPTPVGEVEAPPPPVPAEQPELEIVKREDGSFAVELKRGVDIVQESPKRWRILPISPEPEEFSVAKLFSEGIESFVAYVKRNALELIKFGQVIVSKIVKGVFLLFMTLMVAAYLIMTREQIVGFFRSLPPPRVRGSFDRLVYRIDRGLAGVVRGQLLICLVNGVLSAIGFWMFGLKYWPILSIVAGVMSIIPIFGSILSSIPAVLIGLTQDFWVALWVLLWIIGIHQVEANLLNPKIIGVAAKIHPVLVVFALIVGEHFFGLWGALLAVPALSIAQNLFQHFRYESLPEAESSDSLRPPPLAAAVSAAPKPPSAA